MPRYKVLKSVAHNIGDSFTSLMNYAVDDYPNGNPHCEQGRRWSGLVWVSWSGSQMRGVYCSSSVRGREEWRLSLPMVR
jgi:hypothetical protein